MLPAFKQIPITATSLQMVIRQLNVVADNIALALNAILKRERLDCIVVPGVALTAATELAVPHKLGRQPVGWDIVDVQGGALAIERTAWDARTITLKNANTCVVSVETW